MQNLFELNVNIKLVKNNGRHAYLLENINKNYMDEIISYIKMNGLVAYKDDKYRYLITTPEYLPIYKANKKINHTYALSEALGYCHDDRFYDNNIDRLMVNIFISHGKNNTNISYVCPINTNTNSLEKKVKRTIRKFQTILGQDYTITYKISVVNSYEKRKSSYLSSKIMKDENISDLVLLRKLHKNKSKKDLESLYTSTSKLITWNRKSIS